MTFWVQSEHSQYKAEKVDIMMFSMQLVSCNILLLKAEFLRGILWAQRHHIPHFLQIEDSNQQPWPTETFIIQVCRSDFISRGQSAGTAFKKYFLKCSLAVQKHFVENY